MNAGAYRDRITIEKCSYEADAIGNRKAVWAEYWAGFAYVNNLSGAEYWAAAQVKAEETVQFILRYTKMLDVLNSTGYRIRFRGDSYNIESVDNVRYRNETVKIRARRE